MAKRLRLHAVARLSRFAAGADSIGGCRRRRLWRMRSPHISIPITLTAALAVVATGLSVVWPVLVAREVAALTGGFSVYLWGLVLVGALLFAAIIGWMILQLVWLVREIRTNQRQQTFMDAVTHELHTPLASLQLYLDTLRSQELDETQRLEFLEIMSEDLVRLQRTIDQILQAARSDGRRRWRSWVDLGGLLRECVQDACKRHGLSEDCIRLSVPRGAQVRGDANQLRMVFRNLIDNAVRYGGAKLEVDISARAHAARKLEIEVADHGIGIAPFELSKVFQRFQRLPKEGFNSRGLGLGLFIVRNIVRAHGGSVRAQSEGLGNGSRFVVILPGVVDGYAHPVG